MPLPRWLREASSCCCFGKIDPLLEATIIFAVISSMLIGLLFLIRDMDNPFEIGGYTCADVDLETLVYLETYFDEQDAEMERLAGESPCLEETPSLKNAGIFPV